MERRISRTPLRMDRHVQSRLGAELRSLLAGIEGEPLPDEHVYLLLALRQRERALRRLDS